MLRIHERKGTAVVTVGRGAGSTDLAAFDHAEQDANIIALNAVKFSSFIPPGWEVSEDESVLDDHTHSGRCLPMAYEYAFSTTKIVSAAVAVGIPKDKSKPCIIMEHASDKLTKEEIYENTERSVEEVFKSRGWKLEKIVGKSVEANPKVDHYACAFAAVVFVPEA